MAEVCVLQTLRFVPHDTRRNDDLCFRVLVTKTVNVVDYLITLYRIEDFVQAIQQQHHALRLGQQQVQVGKGTEYS